MFYWIILSLQVYSSSVREYVVITKINSKYHHTTTVICPCGIYGFLVFLYFTSTRFMVYLMKAQGCAILFWDQNFRGTQEMLKDYSNILFTSELDFNRIITISESVFCISIEKHLISLTHPFLVLITPLFCNCLL